MTIKNQKRYQSVKRILQKDGLQRELIHDITDSGNCSQGMKRRQRII